MTPDVDPATNETSGPRLLYRMNDDARSFAAASDATLVSPANDSVLQPWRYKAVSRMVLVDSTRQYEVWCR